MHAFVLSILWGSAGSMSSGRMPAKLDPLDGERRDRRGSEGNPIGALDHVGEAEAAKESVKQRRVVWA